MGSQIDAARRNTCLEEHLSFGITLTYTPNMRSLVTNRERLWGLVCLMLPPFFLSGVGEAQPKNHWSAAQLSVEFQDGMIGAPPRVAVTGPYKFHMQVKGVFSSSDERELTLEAKQIRVDNALNDGMLVGIGLVDLVGTCHYELLPGLVSGFVTTTNDGGGFRLGREKEGEPVTVTLQKNPSALCLAFYAAPQPPVKRRLMFGDAVALLPDPVVAVQSHTASQAVKKDFPTFGRVAGVLVDAHTEKPIADMELGLARVGSPVEGGRRLLFIKELVTKSDEKGTFTVEKVAPGDYVVIVNPTAKTTRDVALSGVTTVKPGENDLGTVRVARQ